MYTTSISKLLLSFINFPTYNNLHNACEAIKLHNETQQGICDIVYGITGVTGITDPNLAFVRFELSDNVHNLTLDVNSDSIHIFSSKNVEKIDSYGDLYLAEDWKQEYTCYFWDDPLSTEERIKALEKALES